MSHYFGRTFGKNSCLRITRRCIYGLNKNQFQAMDNIAGRLCPELGDSEDFLELLQMAYKRYNKPLFVSETDILELLL